MKGEKRGWTQRARIYRGLNAALMQPRAASTGNVTDLFIGIYNCKLLLISAGRVGVCQRSAVVIVLYIKVWNK